MGLFFTFMHSLLLLLFSHQTLAHFVSSMQPLCHDDERFSLLQFKESLVIDKCVNLSYFDSPKVASWTAEEENGNCCSWDGVTCNNITGHVVKLDLSGSCIYGFINSITSLFHLVHLEWLNLAYNDFNQSEIPSEIIKLSSLSHLNLSSSSFSGQIPSEILHLSKLTSLDLSHNYNLELQKPGLRSLGEKLTNVEILNLDWVNISSSIPHILANLSSLTYLSLEGSNMQGEFPAKILQLPNLQFLSVSGNSYLTGYLPNFEKGNPLRVLRLLGTGFSGDIPNSIGNLKSLVSLVIDYSNFSGTNLPSLGNLESLQELYLSYNNFSSQNSRSLSWISKLRNLTSLDLSEINLFGEIPSWLMNLTQLSELRMGRNQLTGPIPNWLMNMNKLTALNLANNQLTGHIPSEIRNLSQLTYLHLESNRLEGPVPSSISELENLQELTLSSNNLSGKIDLDMFLSKLKSLAVLVLSSNNLSVHTETTVDTGFRRLFNVELSSCNLRKFPKFLQNQDLLHGLDLSSNKIGGLIPGWLLNISIEGLSFLNLSHNLLTGFDKYPVILRSWNGGGTVPLTLDLSYNKLRGPLPVPSVFTYSYLVSNNQLTGEISPSVCSLNRLYALDLSQNNLTGMLPDCLGNFSYQLSLLKLQGNKFHGSIPDNFMRGTYLRMIDLSQNLLQGRLPKSLVNCKMLEFLDLGSNAITDIFPSWLGALPELKVLSLKLNIFYGVIKEPMTNFEFPKLRFIDLSHNRFTGNLPSKYFQYWNDMKFINASQLTYMQVNLQPNAFFPSIDYGYSDYSLKVSNKGIEMEYLRLSNLFSCIDLSSNEFVGEIPSSIGDLKGLRCLNLSRNNLQGRIPESFRNLTVLESLDLSNNKLYGEIPQQLVELTSLAFFDVSHNNLSGPIPQGKQFNTFENSSFDGNLRLCGEPLSKRCESSDAPQEEDEESTSAFVFGWKIVLIGCASGLIMGLVLGHTVTTWKSKWFAKAFTL